MKEDINEKKYYGLEADLLFKHVFTKEQLLKQFLKDIFDQEISKIKYLNKELTKENKNLKYGICDMVIETDEEIILLELQNKDLQNIEPRIWMYMSKLYTQNWKDEYIEVKPVKVYLILNYEYKESKVLKEYQEIEKEIKEQFGKYGEIKIWNLKEAKKEKENIHAYYGMLFNPEKKNLETLKKYIKYKPFVECIEKYNMNYETYKEMKEAEHMEMTFEQVCNSLKKHYLEEGMEQGMKRGAEQEKINILTRMLKKNISIKEIMEITGLTEEEIKKYQEK